MSRYFLFTILSVFVTTTQAAETKYDLADRPVMDEFGKRLEYTTDIRDLLKPLTKPATIISANQTLELNGSSSIDFMQRFALMGYSPGYDGMIADDFDNDGKKELLVTESRGTEGYWYALKYKDGAYHRTHISDPFSTRIAELNKVDWQGVNAVMAISEAGDARVYRASNFSLIESFQLPANQESIRNFAYARDEVSSERLLFVVYGYWDGPMLVYSYPEMQVLWSTSQEGSDVADVEVANLDDDPGLEVAIMAEDEFRALDWNTKTEQWSFTFPRFSTHVKIGNLDLDPALEVAGITSWETAFIADVADQTVKFIQDLDDLESLSLADINNDGVHELVIGEGQWGGTKIFDAVGLGQIAYVANPEHGVGGTAVSDFDSDGFIELAWGGGESSTGPDILAIGDVFTGQLEWAEAAYPTTHTHFEVADLDMDSVNELVLLASGLDEGVYSGFIHVYDLESGEKKWQNEPTVNGLGWADSNALDIVQYDLDPQMEVVVGVSYGPSYIYVFDGLSGALELSIELVDNYSQSIGNLRVLQYQGETMFGVNIDGRLSLFDDKGFAHWTSDPLTMDVDDLWMHDTNDDGDDELLVTLSGGIVIYDLPSVSPGPVFLDSVASSMLEDIDNDGSLELVLGKVSGAIRVINPVTLGTEANYMLPSGADSLAFVPGLLGSNFIVGSGNNAVSHLDLSDGRSSLVATIPGESFGSNSRAIAFDSKLDIIIGSNYAVHHLRVSPDAIFRSGLE
ncbi:MAG: hypothetical protein QNK19_17465 [Xanthomonadales bacterium]|nr:hypothetical protein [Xanthomonadales bacterium]